jgi:hypothetical protein
MKSLITSFATAALLIGGQGLAAKAQGSIASPSAPMIRLAQADESALVTENRNLLLRNRELARKIAASLGITSTGDVPTSGTPLEQNQILILQNQETFRAIAAKLGANVPTLPQAAGADAAEKNHNLLLQNRQIVRAILDKLGLTPAAPAELTGSFVQKNNVLLVGNGATLARIADKLGVK